jgi:hypothetical protein
VNRDAPQDETQGRLSRQRELATLHLARVIEDPDELIGFMQMLGLDENETKRYRADDPRSPDPYGKRG